MRVVKRRFRSSYARSNHLAWLISFSGKGHLSDEAVLIGLHGIYANELEIATKKALLHEALENKVLKLANQHCIHFDYSKDLIFDNKPLARHQNALILKAFNAKNEAFKRRNLLFCRWRFVHTEKELDNLSEESGNESIAYDFSSLRNC